MGIITTKSCKIIFPLFYLTCFSLISIKYKQYYSPYSILWELKLKALDTDQESGFVAPLAKIEIDW